MSAIKVVACVFCVTLCFLRSSNFRVLATGTFGSLLESLTSDQLKSFTPEQLRSFTATHINAFSPDQIQQFSPDQVKEFSPNQIGEFSVQQLLALTADQVRSLSTNQLAQLSPDQWKAFTADQWRSFTPEQLKSFTPDLWASFTPDQLKNYFAAYISSGIPEVVIPTKFPSLPTFDIPTFEIPTLFPGLPNWGPISDPLDKLASMFPKVDLPYKPAAASFLLDEDVFSAEQDADLEYRIAEDQAKRIVAQAAHLYEFEAQRRLEPLTRKASGIKSERPERKEKEKTSRDEKKASKASDRKLNTNFDDIDSDDESVTAEERRLAGCLVGIGSENCEFREKIPVGQSNIPAGLSSNLPASLSAKLPSGLSDIELFDGSFIEQFPNDFYRDPLNAKDLRNLPLWEVPKLPKSLPASPSSLQNVVFPTLKPGVSVSFPDLNIPDFALPQVLPRGLTPSLKEALQDTPLPALSGASLKETLQDTPLAGISAGLFDNLPKAALGEKPIGNSRPTIFPVDHLQGERPTLLPADLLLEKSAFLVDIPTLFPGKSFQNHPTLFPHKTVGDFPTFFPGKPFEESPNLFSQKTKGEFPTLFPPKQFEESPTVFPRAEHPTLFPSKPFQEHLPGHAGFNFTHKLKTVPLVSEKPVLAAGGLYNSKDEPAPSEAPLAQQTDTQSVKGTDNSEKNGNIRRRS